jgi:hypothetical protein
MTFRTLGLTAAVLFSLSVAPAIFAHEGNDHAATASDHSMTALHGQLIPAKDAPADWVAKERENYPLDSCPVSEDSLHGDMGGPIDFVYKQEGKPDRLVRFCCKDCVKDFKKDPTKYLNAIDAAAAKRKSASTHT